jgi:hypothetical protein
MFNCRMDRLLRLTEISQMNGVPDHAEAGLPVIRASCKSWVAIRAAIAYHAARPVGAPSVRTLWAASVRSKVSMSCGSIPPWEHCATTRSSVV